MMKARSKVKGLSVCEELGALLAKSQALLDCSEPTLDAWEEYSQMRTEIFDRLATLPMSAEREESASELQDLVARTFETDRLLLHKIEHHLSNLRQAIAAAADRRRAAEVYAGHRIGARTFQRGRI